MKNDVFRDVVLCRSCVNRRFGGTYRPYTGYSPPRLPARLAFSTDPTPLVSIDFPCGPFTLPIQDGEDTFLRNVGSHKIYTAPHPRRRQSSVIEKFRKL
jgi:hypothetical protein